MVIQPTLKPKKKASTTSTTFRWGEAQQKSLDRIIEQLIGPPVLGYADYKLPFSLHTDASGTGLGAALYQHQNGAKRVIAYASRSLKPAEKNYPAHKLEFLALKWAVCEKFHDYLYGTKFEAITDNNPLTYILTTAKLDATGQRWIAALSNYTFDIKYRSGKKNADADGLSRRNEEAKHNVVFPEVLKAISQAVLITAENCPLVDSVALTSQLIDAQQEVPEQVLRATALTDKDWRQAQQEDPTIDLAIQYLKKGARKPPPHILASPLYDARYLRDWGKLYLQNDILYRTGTVSNQEFQQLVVPLAYREGIFTALHSNLGHQGRDRTTSLIKQRFYWPCIDEFVREKVGNCDRCTRRKSNPGVSAKLVNIESTAPLDIVCVDFLSLERSKGGIENVLVITDHFSRYAQAFPTSNQTAKTTARTLFDKFIAHYGFPARVHSDQGQNFESKLIKELCEIAGVEKSHTTPYHAMGNGQVERFNQTLLQMLGTLEEYQKSDWKSHVPTLVHAYNATIHGSTGYSPYFLMFGRHPRLAIDAFLGLSPDPASAKHQTEYARKLRERLHFAYRTAHREAQKSAAKHKAIYDLKVRHATLHEGDRVLVK
ncbi:MAG: DDE-type integrase/transposase/recombinase, partial [Candidatus Thiodiazotropha taylori]|nr:DDE-type integrase/transposase/recombinase [Candidatus Thiodiazotropha taylori]MCW4332388.1 RNase H-like domain-containing protein [Candidatus Thiodiazotropha endolucinida]